MSKLIVILLASLLNVSAMAAPSVSVTVRGEPVGKDIIFHYTLTRRGPELILGLTIGVALTDGHYIGTLTIVPVGTTWKPDQVIRGHDEGTLAASATTQPAGWEVRPSLLKLKAAPVHTAIRSNIGWVFPWHPAQPAPAQSSTYRFSVRVPANQGSTAEYLTGIASVSYYHQGVADILDVPLTRASKP